MRARLRPWTGLFVILTATSCGGSSGSPKGGGGAGGGAQSGGAGGPAAGGHGGVNGSGGSIGSGGGGAGGLAAGGGGANGGSASQGSGGGGGGAGKGGAGKGGAGKGGAGGSSGGMPGGVGGGIPETGFGPGAHVIFPPNCATAQTSLLIRGIGNGVTSVSVNGQVADASDASFTTWSKTVTLVAGANDITIDSVDATGALPKQHVLIQQFSSNAAIRRGAGGWKISETALWGFDLNAAATTAYVTDDMVDGIVAYDLASGDGTILSGQDAQIGSGYDPLLPLGALVLEGKGQVLMTNDTVLGSVALSTGNRTVISGQETAAGQDSFTGPWPLFGAGPAFSGFLNHPVHDADKNRVLLADSKAIVAVDLATGNREIVSKVESAMGLTADFTNHRVFFGLGSGISALDLMTQARTTISASNKGQGPALNGPAEIAYDSTRRLLYVGDTGDASSCGQNFSSCRIYSVDIATGNRALLSGPEAGVGPTHTLVSGLIMRRGILFVLNSGFKKYNNPGNDLDNMILAVDPTTGTRVVVVR